MVHSESIARHEAWYFFPCVISTKCCFHRGSCELSPLMSHSMKSKGVCRAKMYYLRAGVGASTISLGQLLRVEQSVWKNSSTEPNAQFDGLLCTFSQILPKHRTQALYLLKLKSCKTVRHTMLSLGQISSKSVLKYLTPLFC